MRKDGCHEMSEAEAPQTQFQSQQTIGTAALSSESQQGIDILIDSSQFLTCIENQGREGRN